MSVLLAILASENDNERLKRHWPYFKLTGWSILGCGTEDGSVIWPEPVMELKTGKMGVKNTPAGTAIFGLLEQELDIWKFCWDHPEFESVCVVEADNLFVRKPPSTHSGGYQVTFLPNCSPAGLFKTPVYFSTPRWADRDTAGLLYAYGSNMLQRGEVEHYMSDRFPALICQEFGIPVSYTPNWSPSVNASGENEWRWEAIRAIRGGAWCLHSVKTTAQLNSLKGFLPQCQ